MNYCPLTDNMYLKSNMDRFIVLNHHNQMFLKINLKSNMDRFIGFYYKNGCSIIPNLKSNMDRFIVIEPNSQLSFKILFKIQYG